MLTNLDHDLKKAEEHLHNEFNKLQVGRANPSLFEGITVHAYGSNQPIKNLANIGVLDAQTVTIQPWDRSVLRDIAKGISDANLGLTPQDNGESILIRIPPMTEERRRDLVKIAKNLSEEGKIAVRNVRQEYLKRIKASESEKTISEDQTKQFEAELQKKIDTEMKKIEEMLKHKENEVMKI